MFHWAAHDLVCSISVAATLAVLSAPALAQTTEPDARHNLPDPSKLPLHHSPWGAPNAWDLERTTWDRSLQARLERFNRYSPEGCARGVVGVIFDIDRQGHVLKSRIFRSSGSSSLDREALAIIKRADPFPTPPNGLPDKYLSIGVPISFVPLPRHACAPPNR
jgi:periplasmic protein TonB